MRKTLIAGWLCLMVSTAAGAVVYKWVDENGKTHYSQSPPPGRPAEKLKPPPPAPAKPAASVAKPSENKKDEKDAAGGSGKDSPKPQDKKAQAQREEECEKVRRNLEALESTPHVLKTEADGTRSRITEEERQEAMKRARQQLSEHCQ